MRRPGQTLRLSTVFFALTGLIVFSSAARAADMFEGFADVSDLTGKGWNFQNLSSPVGSIGWFQGLTEFEGVPVFDAQAGPANSYLAANFNNTGTTGTIDNWAITPTLTYSNGDTFSFYTRTETGSSFPDRLQVRMSTSGSSVNVNDFTLLLHEINPGLTTGGYPVAWTQINLTISGLAGPTSGRIAFRYFVTNSGSEGDYGNYIGIDTLAITTAVPEPSTIILTAAVVPVLWYARKRRPAIA